MKRVALFAGLALAAGMAAAQVKVGVTLSVTGPAASLGIPERNTLALAPKQLGGLPVQVIVLDDGSDPTRAVANTQKLVAEEKVDAILGSTITPNSLAMVEALGDKETPLISLSASARIVEPVDAKRRWVFKTPQNDTLMANAIVQHMARNGVKSVAYIGFSNAYGESWYNEFSKLAQAAGLKIVANEKYAPTDASTVAQALKIVGANPDAVLIGASGTPAFTPQAGLLERGYKGRIYQTHGVANADFLRVGGKALDGTLVPVGPNLVAEQLPDSHPSKKPALEYIRVYEGQHGAGSRSLFGALTWDSWFVLDAAVAKAAKSAKPGTPEFRRALRDALEQTKDFAAATGVYNWTPTDHAGLDDRAVVMVRIQDGAWRLAP
jgi:branched-chain amino acid transport system substrate-binding protein